MRRRPDIDAVRDRQRHHDDRDPPHDEEFRVRDDPVADAQTEVAAYWNWRDEVASASGLNFLVGVWLIASPLALAYGDGDAIWNPIASGAIVALLALVRFSGAYRQSWLSGVNVLVGGWVFASAFWLADTTAAAWNELIAGALIVALAVWSMSATEEGQAEEGERRSRVRHRGHHPPTGA